MKETKLDEMGARHEVEVDAWMPLSAVTINYFAYKHFGVPFWFSYC